MTDEELRWRDPAAALRELAPSGEVPPGLRPLMQQAASEIQRLRAENSMLRYQLKASDQTLEHERILRATHEPRVRLSDMADELIRELRRQGMVTMQSVFDGSILKIQPDKEGLPDGVALKSGAAP